MTREKFEAEWRSVNELYRAWGNRTGRRPEDWVPTCTSYPLTFYEAADGDNVQAKRNRSLVARRIPRGRVPDIDHLRSPRLQEFLAALPTMRAFRDELQGRRPADPTRQALECLCAEIAGAARWARTVELEPARAKHRRRDVGSAA